MIKEVQAENLSWLMPALTSHLMALIEGELLLIHQCSRNTVLKWNACNYFIAREEKMPLQLKVNES